jgi:probable phosphoglycerate mutase
VAIYLVRHGETASNAARVVQTPDAQLSPRGHEQARRLARRLAGTGVRRILASDLSRAAATAEAVRAATGAELWLEPLLQERNFGDLRGTPYAELGLDLFAPDLAPPGGETWGAFHARVDRAWERVLAVAGEPGGELAVVTHGLVCLSLATRRLAVPGGVPLELTGFANASVTIVEAAPPWRVTRLNCTEHLGKEADPKASEGGPPQA